MIKVFKFLLLFSYLIVFCCVNNLFVCGDDTNVYTAMATLEQLLPTEEILVTSLQSYIFNEERKLKQLRHYLEDFRVQNEIAYRNKLEYFANPINAFLIIKRLFFDWQQIVQLIATNSSEEFLQELSTKDLKFPSEDDFSGAADALSRLQTTYKLEASSMALGELNGVKYSTEMSSSDCRLIGIHTYFQQEYNQSIQWLQEALIRLESEAYDANTIMGLAAILEYLSYNHYKMGNLQKAVDVNNKLLKIDPKNLNALKSREHYQNVTSFHEDQKITRAQSTEDNSLLHEEYKELCRGEEKIDEEIRSQLKCYYYNPEGNYFVQIAPFKVEEAYKSPLLLIFHDVMSNNEIEIYKSLAQPILGRAQVAIEDVKKPASYRIGQLAWLYDEYYPQVHPLNKRIEDMTGLTTTSSDALQILNYGIGGYYAPHFDYDYSNKFEEGYVKARIATLLFYMNDVEQGGATVFPKLGVTLWPKKGAAAFWYNLHSDLRGDERTYHAACPVLVGYKWIANKWIHDSDQIFRKPCHLKPSLS